ncbi:hypothetical protein GWK47_050508 [Chionoecetes opilio]|uniref:Uncharacterized protein n=1 Tax=Chionoecetes opilio TaxID=41210 RepID=A0A8J4YAR8_CHIOP|nr:hypothetical protein GWK47_050508 [Chionoecetes opilio]
MATDTKDARMPPAASRYCYCVCDKKRRKHPGVRLQLFPKDARRSTRSSWSPSPLTVVRMRQFSPHWSKVVLRINYEARGLLGGLLGPGAHKLCSSHAPSLLSDLFRFKSLANGSHFRSALGRTGLWVLGGALAKSSIPPRLAPPDPLPLFHELGVDRADDVEDDYLVCSDGEEDAALPVPKRRRFGNFRPLASCPPGPSSAFSSEVPSRSHFPSSRCGGCLGTPSFFLRPVYLGTDATVDCL